MRTKTIVFLLAATALASAAALGQGFSSVKEFLTGYEEIPSVSTAGSGQFDARIRGDEIEWQLRYSNLEGTIQQAHIHIGNVGVNGGITVFLCTNLGNGPAGTQSCPAPPATISGRIFAADVSPNIPATAGARTQGLNTGEIDELIAAMRAGALYVNVHTTTWPGGEVRSQIQNGTR